MKYCVKVNCYYYVDVEAENEEHALECAVDENYGIEDLQGFEYEIADEYNY